MDGRKQRHRDKAFKLPDEPVSHITIDRRAMYEIRDRAHKIHMKSLKPDAVLCMFQALKEYMEKRGAVANFTVPMEGESNE